MVDTVTGRSTRAGLVARATYSAFFEGFLGGASSWQQVSYDGRTYVRLTGNARHRLAVWLAGDFVVAGTAPYLDLPATGMDTYGRSGRGYPQGRFPRRKPRVRRGGVPLDRDEERPVRDGGVSHTQTFGSDETGEKLFDSFATGAGFGFRLMLNKRSQTNLCFRHRLGRRRARTAGVLPRVRGRSEGETMTRKAREAALAVLAWRSAAGTTATAQDLQQKLAARSRTPRRTSRRCARTAGSRRWSSASGRGQEHTSFLPLGADGKVQKTAVVGAAPAREEARPAGQVIEEEEGRDEGGAGGGHRPRPQYVPPEPGLMQVVMNAGTASLAQAGPGVLVLKFSGYVKPGDALSLTFDSAVKSLRQLDVSTYLDTPESPVTLKVAMQGAAGRNAARGERRPRMPARQIEVRITNTVPEARP